MAQEIADSTLLDTWGSGGNIVEPDISKIIEGWQLGEQPPHEYMNWLQNTFGSKLNHILKNGVPVWNNTTQYLAGSSVQHNGNAWLCKTTNTNSEPTDVNANWKRIITVESLTTVLNGYVATTGDQDIDNIKTFLKSPIVPTPTTGTQAANKDYVDSNAGEVITAGTGLEKTGTTLNFYPFGLATATTELVTSDYVVVSDNTTPKKITLENLMAELGETSSFQNSKSANGYTKLANGLIIQWGQNGAVQSVTFPIAFPNACLTVVATMYGSSSAQQINEQSTINYTTTGFQYASFTWPKRWFAIGY